jgi:CRISPR-associated protein Csh1
MITELTKYIAKISKQFPLKDFVRPTEGLHIMLEVRDEQVHLYKAELYQPKKGEEDSYSDFLREECLSREMHMRYINSNKAISDKKIHSASPFAFMLKKQSLDDKQWMNNWSNNIKQYFAESLRKCSVELSEEQNNTLKSFHNYCSDKITSTLKEQKEYEKLKTANYITLYLKNFSVDLYQKANQVYLENNLFNKPDYNETINGELYGASDFYNGFNAKKPFLIHQTAPFDINFRIPQSVSRLLFLFDKYRQTGKALKTNPLIIFIDKEDLNNEVVNVIKTEGNQISFHDLMHKLFKHKSNDLSNYYLLYFLGGDIKDVDFVSSFRYELDVKIQQVIPTTQPEKDLHIGNIFHFEQEILHIIFSNQLIKRWNEGNISFRYFEDVDNNPKYITGTQWQLIIRYRKAFYDFIYKNRRQSVTSSAFHDIMRQGIVDDIRHDEIQHEQHSKTNAIRQKLNIWFSLWDFFANYSNKNDLKMANKIVEHQTRLRTIRDNPNMHIQSDDEFAFAAGQIIYYLLTKSKSANLTHSALEPFLQKTDSSELKKAIANTFNAYKHEIDFGQGRFEKLCGEVMDYDLDGNLKELMPYVLAGYFSNSLIYEKKTETI